MWKRYPAESSVEGLFQFLGSPGTEEVSTWTIDARGGTYGVALFKGDSPPVVDSPPNAQDSWLRLQPVGQDLLPSLDEQFVRGDELHLWYPQQQGSYALRLMFRPMAVSVDSLVLEMVVSIQTDLLDSHSMIDVTSVGQDTRCLTDAAMIGSATGSAPINISPQDTGQVAVILGPHDRPFTSDVSGRGELRLRLFGEFLEKGVIRKARPWVILRRGTEPFDETELWRFSHQLAASPLPLAT